MKFLVINLKRNLFTILCFAFLLLLIFYSSTNIEAAKNGLSLWVNSVLPTLFPFFIAAELLSKTNFINILGKLLNKFMRPIFNLPGESAIAVILGNISGYPIGTKTACNLKKNNICTKEEAERLISFTNNSGPLFIIGSVGITMFGSPKIGYILYISHFISSILVGILFRNWKNGKVLYRKEHKFIKKDSKTLKLSTLGEFLGNAITNSISSVLFIGGFVVLFSVILSILNTSGVLNIITNILYNFGIPKNISQSLITGLIELTNGVKLSSNLYSSYKTVSILLTSFLLGISGLSVLLQIYSITSRENISIKPYIYGKFLQSIFSVIITFILI